MELGLIRSIDINHEMQQAYLDYAMSVIVARALPDARDGLKPVHRRILYAMHDMGMRPDSAYKKSARIVGEVLGKYHPHGDAAVYESMARMAQDFSMRTLLVDGQGNFGSVDGDPPAAMRYTEARLTSAATHLLADIAKNTVDFVDNFDGSLQEPVVLPAAIPNLIVNGATGIAVGMSTNIPPHNLGEVVDALRYMLANWEKLDDITVEDLMNFIKGPDFPTGGIMLPDSGENDLKAAYGTGRGRVTIQARLHTEEMDRGRSRIIVTELPYMVNKSSLIERIAELAREERIEGLADLRDESDRQGLRIVIELSKTVEPEKVLQELFKHTPLRDNFHIILLALVDGEPRLLSLKQALRVYLDHRLVVIRRRSEYELEKARARSHILEGYLTALKNLDEIIALIRKSPDADTARTRLMKQFKLSEIQAQAILEMQLRRLAALERKKIEEEYKELQATIKGLEALLKSPKQMRDLCSDELAQAKELYGDRRRTFIAGAASADTNGTATLHAIAPDHRVWLSVTNEGLISRSLTDKAPRASGTSAPRHVLQANTRDVLYLAAANGECAAVPIHTLPEAETPPDGIPFWKVSAFSEGTELAALFTLPPKDQRPEEQYAFTCTRQGLVKKSLVSELPGPSAKPFTLVKVNEEDSLGWVCLTDGKADILLATADGMAIRFSEDEVRPMGLVAAGVGGIKLGGRDEVISMEILPEKGEVLLVTATGKAKRCTAALFPKQGRYGQGVLAWKLPRADALAGIAVGKPSTRVILHLTKLAPKAIRFDDAPLQTRVATGKDILEVKAGVQVLGLTVLQSEASPEAAPSVPKKPAARKTASPPPVAEQLALELAEPAKPARKPTAKPPAAEKKKAEAKTESTTPKPAAPKTSTAKKAPATSKPPEPSASKPAATKTPKPKTPDAAPEVPPAAPARKRPKAPSA
jgi:DNA gyrase subunit A